MLAKFSSYIGNRGIGKPWKRRVGGGGGVLGSEWESATPVHDKCSVKAVACIEEETIHMTNSPMRKCFGMYYFNQLGTGHGIGELYSFLCTVRFHLTPISVHFSQILCEYCRAGTIFIITVG